MGFSRRTDDPIDELSLSLSLSLEREEEEDRYRSKRSQDVPTGPRQGKWKQGKKKHMEFVWS